MQNFSVSQKKEFGWQLIVYDMYPFGATGRSSHTVKWIKYSNYLIIDYSFDNSNFFLVYYRICELMNTNPQASLFANRQNSNKGTDSIEQLVRKF